jgi:hypothetical protein
MKAAWDWVEADIEELIRNQTQENLELDYKACAALAKTDARKTELSKDVSAFANSAGGTIVYGVHEQNHVPTAIDVGYDQNDISKEWLEQVINSGIQRRIDGIRINPVQLTATPGKVIYVVSIPQSMRAPHMALDKRFYKRFNFSSVPMEEYEVRDVGRRSETPDLEISMLVPCSKEKPNTSSCPFVAMSATARCSGLNLNSIYRSCWPGGGIDRILTHVSLICAHSQHSKSRVPRLQ